MELRQIKCFIAVAEELHFRRAAERVGLAQTALSAQIRNLEDELGFPLLFRTTRHVSLTQAGAVFLDETRTIMERLEGAVDLARNAASGGLQRLRLGGIDAALSWFLPPVIEAYRREHPDFRVSLTEVSSSDQQLQDLLSHRIDLAFFRPPTAMEGVEWETLYEEKVFVAVPSKSALARRKALAVEDIANEKIISYARPARPLLASMVTRSFEAAGLRPDIELEVLEKSTLLRLVGHGAGVGLVPQWTTESSFKGVVFRPFSSATGNLNFGVAWRAKSKGQTIESFLKFVRREAVQVQARFAKMGVSAD